MYINKTPRTEIMQKAEGRRQTAEGRRQKAEGRRQKAEGRRQKAEHQMAPNYFCLLPSAFCFLPTGGECDHCEGVVVDFGGFASLDSFENDDVVAWRKQLGRHAHRDRSSRGRCPGSKRLLFPQHTTFDILKLCGIGGVTIVLENELDSHKLRGGSKHQRCGRFTLARSTGSQQDGDQSGRCWRGLRLRLNRSRRRNRALLRRGLRS